MQDYADYKVMTQEDRRKLFSLLQVLKRELDGPKPPAQVCHLRTFLRCPMPMIRCCAGVLTMDVVYRPRSR